MCGYDRIVCRFSLAFAFGLSDEDYDYLNAEHRERCVQCLI